MSTKGRERMTSMQEASTALHQSTFGADSRAKKVMTEGGGGDIFRREIVITRKRERAREVIIGAIIVLHPNIAETVAAERFIFSSPPPSRK